MEKEHRLRFYEKRLLTIFRLWRLDVTRVERKLNKDEFHNFYSASYITVVFSQEGSGGRGIGDIRNA